MANRASTTTPPSSRARAPMTIPARCTAAEEASSRAGRTAALKLRMASTKLATGKVSSQDGSKMKQSLTLCLFYTQHWQHCRHRPCGRGVRPPDSHVLLLLLPLLPSPQEQERDWQVLGRPKEEPHPGSHGQWPDPDGKLSPAARISATIPNAASHSSKPAGHWSGVHGTSPAGNVLSRSKRLCSSSCSPFNEASHGSELSSNVLGTISYTNASTNVCASTSSTAAFTARELSGPAKPNKPTTICVSRVK